jgi:glycosidase
MSMGMKLRKTTVYSAALLFLCHGSVHAQKAEKPPWYVAAGAIHRVTLKPSTKYWRFEHLSLDPVMAKRQMLQWKSEGITALEVFAPEEGGNSYDGLDTKDRFQLDPGLGSVTDFRRLVALAHSLGMRVITFQNLGYSSVDGTQFERAEDAVRRGETTPETRMFFWSKSKSSVKPGSSNSYFFCQPDLPNYDPGKSEFWQWSDRAGTWYWTRWRGKDAEGATNHLPQYNWSGTAWPEEATHVVRFWMNTGLDGMVLDAVNWYPGATWEKVHQHITGVIAGYGGKLSQPEGGGGFHDDPVGWVKEGGFTNIYDYGLGIWWNKTARPLMTSVEDGQPEMLEDALQKYHDRVVAAGGTLYFPVPKMENAEDQKIVEALVATSGDMPCYCDPVGGVTAPADGISALLKLKPGHPALFQNSQRRRIPTSNSLIYATERYAADDSERLLVVFNFSREPMNATVDVGDIRGKRFIDLLSEHPADVADQKLTLSLAGHGYEIFAIRGYQLRQDTATKRQGR